MEGPDQRGERDGEPGGSRRRKPARAGPDPHVEALIVKIVHYALTGYPLHRPKKWYWELVLRLEGTPHEPPTIGAFTRRYTAERKRREALRMAASANAVALFGEFVRADPRVLKPLLGTLTFRIRAGELITSALTVHKSHSVIEGYRYYCSASYRASVTSVSEEEFRAFVLSPAYFERVPHELMPKWWTSKAPPAADPSRGTEGRADASVLADDDGLPLLEYRW